TYDNQAWYTQGHNLSPIFIANNAVHEYLSQGNIHESLDLASVSGFRRASALAAAAKARAEVASRGLVVTVVEDYYAVAAAQQKPDVRAALEIARAAGFDVTAARAGYLPSLSFDYWYGIDAPQFAVNAPSGVSNLGSSVMGTLTLPIWNWGATQSRIKQAELRRAQAQRELSFAQRKLLAEIKSLYSEAATAMSELVGLSRSAH